MRLTNYPVAHFLNRLFLPALLLTFSFGLSQNKTFAQASGQRELPANLQIIEARGNAETKALAPMKSAIGNDLYCAGFINSLPTPNTLQIVGAELENSRAHYGQGDIVYLNAGRTQQIEAGLMYSVVRPVGDFRSPFDHTSGQRNLGVFTLELGVLRVITVQEHSAVARIIFSCGDMELGDQLRAFEERPSVSTDLSMPLPRYQPTSGKQAGRIVLQRDQREILSPRDVVYLDLGKDNGVNVGEKFTIFRHFPDDSKVFRYNDDDINVRRSGGFGSDSYKGGTYSKIHPREGRQKVKNERKDVPRTIIGELVIISIQPKSATAIITRTTQEVHTGDHIEAQ